MTAVAGFWAQSTPADPARVCEAMLRALAAYGPDRSDSAVAGDLALGRALFRLLPEDEADRQPVADGKRRGFVVADLRLDNRDELGAALGLGGDALRTCADSNLLFLALERWGEGALDRIEGDYAFAWYDADARRLLLARDPLGQRPLFWHQGEGFIAFASMPAGLHATGMIPRAPDEGTAARHLAQLPPEEDRTFYRGVRRVLPGRVVTITPSGHSTRRHWTPKRQTLRLKSFDDYVEAYRFELDRTVACRLRGAGATVAAQLSGGWDSSAVTATAARLVEGSGTRVAAFTATPASAADAPRDRFADEGPLAAAVAAAFANIDHIFVPSSGVTPLAGLDRYRALFDRPVFNLCNHGWLADIRLAARDRGARVMLTGELGNWTISAAPNNALAELVSEGRWRDWRREAMAMLRQRRARLRGVAANSFAPWLPAPLWKRLRRLSSAPEPELRNVLHPALREALRHEEEARELGPVGRPRDRFSRMAALLEEVDFGEYRKGVLAGWGMDERDPTADPRLVQFCLSLPIDMLMSGGVRRPLARAALADRVPAAILDEPKKGYQGADWGEALGRDLAALDALVEAIAADPAAGRVIDLAQLRRLRADWPQDGWATPRIIGLYRIGLLNALAAGHFLIGARSEAAS